MYKLTNNEITYGIWLRKWLSMKETYLKQATFANYQENIEKHILPTFGNLPVSEITEEKIQQTVLFWLENGRCDGQGGLSERTVKSIVMLMKLTLKAAAKAGFCPTQEIHILFPLRKNRKKYKLSPKKNRLC